MERVSSTKALSYAVVAFWLALGVLAGLYILIF